MRFWFFFGGGGGAARNLQLSAVQPDPFLQDNKTLTSEAEKK
jgi:hypothetical protein